MLANSKKVIDKPSPPSAQADPKEPASMPETRQNPPRPAATAPLFDPSGQDAPFALYQGQQVNRGNLWADARELATSLPDRPYVFNLCENRYRFCLLLLAAAQRGQTTLLPPSGQAGMLKEIAADYPGAYLASDLGLLHTGLEGFTVAAPGASGKAPAIPLTHASLVAFTSGSTGKPKPCAHSFATFRISAEMAVRSLGLGGRRLLMLSTTPPQHMYGLETSVFWPLFSDLILYDGRPFFPEDLRLALESAPWPVVLASTPTHLRSLILAAGRWGKLAAVLSATDGLPEKLARDIETATGVQPCEIYGSTETLSFARRQTLRESLWQPYAGASLTQDGQGPATLLSPHLPGPVELPDSINVAEDGRFAVAGRHADMVKIGGKRASLAELNRRLRDLEGVEDGFCFVQEGRQGEPRLAAVVVGQLDIQSIRQGLRPYLDEVFLPRKIHYVQAIPRNAVGKLAKAEIEKLLAGLG